MTSAHLRPCPSCARHARVSEDACPFCGAAFAASFRAAARPQPPSGRLTRAALYALGSGTLALSPACGSAPGGHGTEPPDASTTEVGADSGGLGIAFYGSAPISTIAPYGLPPTPFEGDDASAADPVDAGLNAPCSTNDECGSGFTCLFPVGGGCTAQGRCGTEDTCTPESSPVVFCVCGVGGLLELQCAPSHGYVERTTTGPCASADAATDTGTEGILDAASEAETEQ